MNKNSKVDKINKKLKNLAQYNFQGADSPVCNIESILTVQHYFSPGSYYNEKDTVHVCFGDAEAHFETINISDIDFRDSVDFIVGFIWARCFYLYEDKKDVFDKELVHD